MKTKTDNRPRFGWCPDLDSIPQEVLEDKIFPNERSVAVIPLPFMSPKMKAKVREFTKSLWPK